MKVSRAHIEERRDRPKEYFDDFLSLGTWDGEDFVISEEAFTKFRERWALKGPTIVQMLANFAEASLKWLAAGRPMVTEAQYKRRLGPGGCEDCLLFYPLAFEGRGQCRHPDCGCDTELKAQWATETCPDGRAGWA